MKTKDLQKHLNNLVEEIEVSPFDKTRFQSLTYQPNYTNNIVQVNNKKKYRLAFGFVFVFVLVLVGAIIGLSLRNGNPFSPTLSMSKTKKQLAYQTLGVYSLIEASAANQGMLLASTNYDEVKKDIEAYLELAQNYLELSSIEVNLYESNHKEFMYMYNFKVNNEEVWFYFTEEAKVDGDDIDEVSSTIQGLLKMNNKEYKVVGEKEVETGEVETTLMIYVSDTLSIEVCQEIENAENEYEFNYYVNRKLQKVLEIEIQEENNKQKIAIEDKDYEGRINNEMEFTLGDKRIICDIETNTYSGKVIIEIINNTYEYIFLDNKKNF